MQNGGQRGEGSIVAECMNQDGDVIFAGNARTWREGGVSVNNEYDNSLMVTGYDEGYSFLELCLWAYCSYSYSDQ